MNDKKSILEGIVSCPSCSADKGLKVSYVNTLHPGAPQLKDLENHVCGSCGLGYSVPFRSSAEMNDFYANHYRSDAAAHKFRSTRNLAKHPSYRAISQWLLCLPFVDRSRKLRVIDIGPGGTATAETTKLLNLDCLFEAIEPDRYSAAALRDHGVTVVEESFSSTTNVPDEAYDVVFLSHVLEHYSGSEVVGISKKIQSMLKNDGILMVEVPNAPLDSYGVQRNNDSPHLLFFSVKSLRLFLESVGFEVLVCSDCRNDYQKEWKKACANINPNSVGWRSKAREFLRLNAPWFIKMIAAFRDFKTKVRHFVSSDTNVYEALGGAEFRYAAGGTSIRAIARPKRK